MKGSGHADSGAAAELGPWDQPLLRNSSIKIQEIEIRRCRKEVECTSDYNMRNGGLSTFEFIVVTIRTSNGVEGHSFGFAGRGSEVAASVATSALRPFFLGKDPLARERLWQEFRTYDRWWHHVPIYAYGPFDICLWDIAGKLVGLPLYRLLGEYRDKVPVYASSFVLPTPNDYAREALEVKAGAWHGYKLHPPGRPDVDLHAYRVCREAVGNDYILMADPVSAYNYPQALRIGRELESLGYYWLEEPLSDTEFHSLRKLTAALDIPICGTEVLAGNHYLTAECIASNVVDIVRTDVSWKGGITSVMKTAHLAESFGVQCEIHSAVYHALEVVNLHCCCAISNCQFFELLYPTYGLDFGMKSSIFVDDQGFAHPPQGPGIGVDWDWDFIDNCTIQKL